MLQVQNLTVHYGVIEAIKDVSFEVNQGDIVTLIGANGAGKTIILKSLSGLIRPTDGQIVYRGEEIHRATPKAIVQKGISHVPEGRHVFSGMTVMENLEMGAFLRKDKESMRRDIQKVFQHFPILEERKEQDYATLSGGEQQMLAMGRAIVSKPSLLLLDEPSMGLAPLFIQEIFHIIEEINKEGTTILLIEQNAKVALEIADHGYVLETGKIVETGAGKALLESEAVQRAYLGG